MSFRSPPKPTQAARVAAIEQRAQQGKDRSRNRSMRDLITRGNKRSGLLGGTESGMRNTTGVNAASGIPVTRL